jgi:hypothetical protein
MKSTWASTHLGHANSKQSSSLQDLTMCTFDCTFDGADSSCVGASFLHNSRLEGTFDSTTTRFPSFRPQTTGKESGKAKDWFEGQVYAIKEVDGLAFVRKLSVLKKKAHNLLSYVVTDARTS